MSLLSLPLILSTFGIIFLAELPDKTALSSLVLATKYRWQEVMAGAWLAMLVQTLIAMLAGNVLLLLPARPVRVAVAVSFLVFATAAIIARQGHPFSVGIGAVLGLWSVMTIAAFAGSRIGHSFAPHRVAMLSSVLFLMVGTYMLYSALA